MLSRPVWVDVAVLPSGRETVYGAEGRMEVMHALSAIDM